MNTSKNDIIFINKALKRVSANAVTSPKANRPLEILAVSKEDKAYIRIVGRISNWNANNSQEFQMKVDELLKAHTEAEVYINSPGGSVLEATEINNQLKRFEKITVIVGASAASAATYFTANYYTKAYSNSQLMIHKPILGVHGNEDQIEKDLRLLKSVTKDYLNTYAKKTGKTTAQIEDLWQGGDHWMSAAEALSEGFIDEIIKEGDAEITAVDVKELEAYGAPIIPKKTLKIKKSKQIQIMSKAELIAFLGLEANATDDQIRAAKNKMKVDAEKYRQSVDDEKTRDLEAEKDRAETLVDEAISDKKIDASQRENYLTLALENYETTEKVLETMKSKSKLSAVINGVQGSVKPGRENWTLEDYLDKDPQAYETMKAEDPEAAKILENQYFS